MGTLKEAGYDVTCLWDASYDKNPCNRKFRDNAGNLRGVGPMDITKNKRKNNATVADDLVLPTMRNLIAQGRGPAVVLAGSRGGMYTLPRLWDLGWRGAAVCVSAGCTFL